MAQQKVLIADDDIHLLNIARLNFERAGFSVATVANGEEVLKYVQRETPDLIVLDIVMPLMDGMETLKALKSNAATKKIPVIMLTIKAEDKDIFQGWKEGAEAYLTKPFDPAEVIIMAQGILRDRREGLL